MPIVESLQVLAFFALDVNVIVNAAAHHHGDDGWVWNPSSDGGTNATGNGMDGANEHGTECLEDDRCLDPNGDTGCESDSDRNRAVVSKDKSDSRNGASIYSLRIAGSVTSSHNGGSEPAAQRQRKGHCLKDVLCFAKSLQVAVEGRQAGDTLCCHVCCLTYPTQTEWIASACPCARFLVCYWCQSSEETFNRDKYKCEPCDGIRAESADLSPLWDAVDWNGIDWAQDDKTGTPLPLRWSTFSRL
jgi:hypothetical protein